MASETEQQKILYNIEAEQAILGKIILNNDYFHKVYEYLQIEYFYEPAHREIYGHMEKMIQKSSLVMDNVTLRDFFNASEILRQIGGSDYIAVLIAAGSGVVDVISYAKVIGDLALKRELAMLGENMIVDAHHNERSAREQIETADEKLFRLNVEIGNGGGFISIERAMRETIDSITLARSRDSHLSGISTGFIDLDAVLNGFQKSDLIILAGRPSMGKTTLAINLAYNVAREFLEERENGSPNDKKSVCFFSLEMPAGQITAKILSLETGIGTDRFRKGMINDEDFIKIAEKAEYIANLPLFIDDTPALNMASLRSRLRRLVKQEKVGFAVIDYLQLLHGVNESSKMNRVLEISEITQGLKAMAKEFSIPILALSQLSRLVEQREEKRPQLSDLRESGSIEQDADIVMFVFREAYYEERKKPANNDIPKLHQWQANMDRLRNRSELIIAKHRNGPIANIDLYFNPDSSKFADYAGYHDA